jgi:type I restriction enzyme R subunit
MVRPEDAARQRIDDVAFAGWTEQDAKALNIHAARGVAISEFLLKTGHGSADYLLCVNGNAVGVQSADRDHITPQHRTSRPSPSLPAVFFRCVRGYWK